MAAIRNRVDEAFWEVGRGGVLNVEAPSWGRRQALSSQRAEVLLGFHVHRRTRVFVVAAQSVGRQKYRLAHNTNTSIRWAVELEGVYVGGCRK